MIRNYLIIAFRQIGNGRLHSIINIFGLAVGFTCCLLIALYIVDELSYDKFHEKGDRIFRISGHSTIGGNERSWSLIPSAVAPAVAEQLPGVETFARITTLSKPNRTIKYGDKLFDCEGPGPYGTVFMADSTIFEVFTYDLTGTSAANALNAPNSVVITRRVADKIFKAEEPLGKTIEFTNLGHYQVTGIIEDFPTNSHLQFDYLISKDYTDQNSPSRGFWVRSYVVFSPHIDPQEVETKLDSIGRAADPSLAANGVNMDYFLQKVSDIHLEGGLEYELYPTSDIHYVYIFLSIAIFVLIIASINFVNLSTAQLGKRAKEVGIRKVMGAGNREMLLQFFIQSFIISTIAFLSAIGLFTISVNSFNKFTGKELSLITFFDPVTILVSIGVVTTIAMFAGIYPAVIMNRLRPIATIKENFNPKSSSQLMKKMLVVFQFSISVILIVATYTIVHQLYYMRNKGLGFDSEKVLTIAVDGNESSQQLKSLRHELLQVSGIDRATISTGVPGQNVSVMVMIPEGFDQSNSQRMDGIYSDMNFLKCYGIELLAGRDFDPQLQSDSLNFVINRSAAEKFGWTVEEAIGKQIRYLQNGPSRGESGYVIGVMEDFHYQALHTPIGPLLLGVHSTNFNAIPFSHISVNINLADLSNTMLIIESIWKNMYHDRPLDYAFVDTTFDMKYEKEERLSKIITSFSILAITLASLGLLGLASFIVQQKTKEIGIRKVLGASILNIWSKLSNSFVVLILFGNLISWPFAYYFLERWLEGFAYRIDSSVWVYILAGLSSVLIALGTIGYKTIKASLANPIDAIRYE